MSLWPFMFQTKPYCLKCPACSNQLYFQAVPSGDQLLWKCGCCGQSQRFRWIDPNLRHS